MKSVYHEGEFEVQKHAGVREMAERIGRGIREEIPEPAREFLRQQPFVVVASVNKKEEVWISILTGKPGFMVSPDERTIYINTTPGDSDPLKDNLGETGRAGLLVIEFASRRRMRLNGRAELRDGMILVRSEQVFSNCPKYIQSREWNGKATGARQDHTIQSGDHLTEEQQWWIISADTFFVGSFNKMGGADASHRGGNPGFVKVINERQLMWPDYAGNNMFQTLGNITANPHAGLLFLDFEKGRTLQLTGLAHVDWNPHASAEFTGAERLVRFEVKQVIETTGVVPFGWRLLSYSPFNPS
jgi:predicted pyridoxine 5'-phosphate oxidase superfamily flavin-nucleotide-binding protein